MYVYLCSERNIPPHGMNLYTVGYYSPDGKWQPESDYNNSEEAAKRVAWLNGSNHQAEEVITQTEGK